MSWSLCWSATTKYLRVWLYHNHIWLQKSFVLTLLLDQWLVTVIQNSLLSIRTLNHILRSILEKSDSSAKIGSYRSISNLVVSSFSMKWNKIFQVMTAVQLLMLVARIAWMDILMIRFIALGFPLSWSTMLQTQKSLSWSSRVTIDRRARSSQMDTKWQNNASIRRQSSK